MGKRRSTKGEGITARRVVSGLLWGAVGGGLSYIVLWLAYGELGQPVVMVISAAMAVATGIFGPRVLELLHVV